jgi:hypothetical protein
MKKYVEETAVFMSDNRVSLHNRAVSIFSAWSEAAELH